MRNMTRCTRNQCWVPHMQSIFELGQVQVKEFKSSWKLRLAFAFVELSAPSECYGVNKAALLAGVISHWFANLYPGPFSRRIYNKISVIVYRLAQMWTIFSSLYSSAILCAIFTLVCEACRSKKGRNDLLSDYCEMWNAHISDCCIYS